MITSLHPGQMLTATRTLRGGEEFLADHFPRFPVMPGVMMLESLHQAAMWMVRTGDEFRHPLVVLRETKSVKFGAFLAPDQTLDIVAKTVKTDGPRTMVKASATRDGRTAVTARLTLECQTLDDERVAAEVLRNVRRQYEMIPQSGVSTPPA